MKKYISYLVAGKLQLLMMLFAGNLVFAQYSEAKENDRIQEFIISYNTPFSYSLNNDVRWKLSNDKGELLKQDTGNFENHVFDIPGNYTLSITEKHNHTVGSCDHAHYPSKLKIAVRSAKMVFDLSTVKFSKNIIGGQSAKGIKVNVNVDYSSTDNRTMVYEDGFTTSGVGTSIIGNLKNNKIILKPGVSTLEFVLDGVAERGNYIMINFKDVNGQIQSYGLTKKIQ